MILHSIAKKVFLLLIIMQFYTHLFADSQTQMKALFLKKIIHLIQWPQNDSADFNICVLNDKDFEQSLKKIYSDKMLNSKQVKFISLSKKKDIFSCNLLFIGKNTKNTLKITAGIAKEPVLTVSDNKDFISDKVMITLFLDKDDFHYVINNKAAHDADISISHLLLNSAQRVINE